MKFPDQLLTEERERAAAINARMEADLLAAAYLHLDMRRRTRQDAQQASGPKARAAHAPFQPTEAEHRTLAADLVLFEGEILRADELQSRLKIHPKGVH